MRTLLVIFTMVLFSFVSFASDVVKVGVYLSTTGPVAAWGRPELEGIKTAYLLKNTVKGKKIRLVVEDVASRPEGAALAAEKLVESGVRFVVGPVASFAALAAVNVFKRNGVVDVIPTANEKGLSENNSLVSRVCFNNKEQAEVMANYIISSGYKSGVIIEDISMDYSVDLAKNFLVEFKKRGGKIKRIYRISSSDTDFSAIAAQLKRDNPEFIYFTTYYNSIALMLRDLKTLGYKGGLFAGSAASSHALIEIAQDAAEGLIFTDDFDPLIPQGSLSERFVKLFKERYNRLPDSPEALAADAYLLLVDSIEKSKNMDPKEVADIARNRTFHGITGKITIKNGLVRRTIVLREIRNSAFRPIAVFEP